MPDEERTLFLSPTPTAKKIGEGIFEGVKPLKIENNPKTPTKLERCIRAVKKQNLISRTKVNPFAVCRTALKRR